MQPPLVGRSIDDKRCLISTRYLNTSFARQKIFFFVQKVDIMLCTNTIAMVVFILRLDFTRMYDTYVNKRF
jgi:hypothetical protein